MLIADMVRERMQMLEITPETLINDFYFEEDFVEKLINGAITIRDIDEYGLAVLSNALRCDPACFSDEKAQKRDVLFGTINRGEYDKKSREAKLYVQEYVRDFVFIEEVMREEALYAQSNT